MASDRRVIISGDFPVASHCVARPELTQLWEVWSTSPEGVHALYGTFGSGKSVLVRQFLELLQASDKTGLPRGWAFSFENEGSEETCFQRLLTRYQGGNLVPAVDFHGVDEFLKYGLTEPLVIVLDAVEKVLKQRSADRVNPGLVEHILYQAAVGEYEGNASFIVTSRLPLYSVTQRLAECFQLETISHDDYFLKERSAFLKPWHIQSVDEQTGREILRNTCALTDVDYGTLNSIITQCYGHPQLMSLAASYLRQKGQPSQSLKLDELLTTTSPSSAFQAIRSRTNELIGKLTHEHCELLKQSQPAALQLLFRMCLFWQPTTRRTLNQIFLDPRKGSVSGRDLARMSDDQLAEVLDRLVSSHLVDVCSSEDGTTSYRPHVAIRQGLAARFDVDFNRGQRMPVHEAILAHTAEKLKPVLRLRPKIERSPILLPEHGFQEQELSPRTQNYYGHDGSGILRALQYADLDAIEEQLHHLIECKHWESLTELQGRLNEVPLLERATIQRLERIAKRILQAMAPANLSSHQQQLGATLRQGARILLCGCYFSLFAWSDMATANHQCSSHSDLTEKERLKFRVMQQTADQSRGNNTECIRFYKVLTSKYPSNSAFNVYKQQLHFQMGDLQSLPIPRYAAMEEFRLTSKPTRPDTTQLDKLTLERQTDFVTRRGTGNENIIVSLLARWSDKLKAATHRAEVFDCLSAIAEMRVAHFVHAVTAESDADPDELLDLSNQALSQAFAFDHNIAAPEIKNLYLIRARLRLLSADLEGARLDIDRALYGNHLPEHGGLPSDARPRMESEPAEARHYANFETSPHNWVLAVTHSDRHAIWDECDFRQILADTFFTEAVLLLGQEDFESMEFDALPPRVQECLTNASAQLTAVANLLAGPHEAISKDPATRPNEILIDLEQVQTKVTDLKAHQLPHVHGYTTKRFVALRQAVEEPASPSPSLTCDPAQPQLNEDEFSVDWHHKRASFRTQRANETAKSWLVVRKLFAAPFGTIFQWDKMVDDVLEDQFADYYQDALRKRVDDANRRFLLSFGDAMKIVRDTSTKTLRLVVRRFPEPEN